MMWKLSEIEGRQVFTIYPTCQEFGIVFVEMKRLPEACIQAGGGHMEHML
jgi:hypothetical protein